MGAKCGLSPLIPIPLPGAGVIPVNIGYLSLIFQDAACREA